MVLSERYVVGARIGAGGMGEVFRAHDPVTGSDVAVKRVPTEAVRSARLRREIGALRALEIPGVVRLYDEIVDDGATWLVMELLDGRPFPGASTQVAWSELAATVEGLLETLGRVHEAGVVHRDLKPDNVLVDSAGRATILDFGLARGEAFDTTITRRGVFAGTPMWASPEQVRGDTPDARADLYAVGLMVRSALTGALPGEDLPADQLVIERLTRSPRPVHELVSDVPLVVSNVLSRLLALDPDDRFQSAADVLAALHGEGSVQAQRLPFLGTRRTIDGLVALAHAATSGNVVGPSGSGRSRALEEAQLAMEQAGLKVVRLPRGSAPFESLRRWRPGRTMPAGSGLRDVAADWEQALGQDLRHRTVFIVDSWDALDRYSRRVVEACRSLGAVLACAEDGPGMRIAPLTVTDLRALFHGPDKILHLREDAAVELARRTGGLPARVAAEVGAWVRAGFAVWDGPQLRVDRAGLDALRGGVALALAGASGGGDGLELRSDQHELLAWVALAGEDATHEVLAQARGADAYEIEAYLEELCDAGAVRLEGRRVVLRVAARALHRWRSDRRAAAHRAIADALPSPSAQRLRHLVLGAQWQARGLSMGSRAPEAGGLGGLAFDTAAPRTLSLADLPTDAISLDLSLSGPGRGDDPARTFVGAALPLEPESVAPLLEEALALAARREREGHVGEAIAAMRVALPLVRERGTGDQLDRLLKAWLLAAHRAGAAVPQRTALHVHDRMRPGMKPLAEAEAVAAHLLAQQGQGQRALEAAETLATTADGDLLRAVYGTMMLAARFLPIEREAALLASLQGWRATSPDAARDVLTWRGLHLYRQGDFDGAAELHLEAADLGDADLRSLVNAASALLDAGRHDEANEVARRCRLLAAEARRAYMEAAAVWLERAAAYRSSQVHQPDAELVEAVVAIGQQDLIGKIALTEAALAWRARRLDLGRELAGLADDAFAAIRHDVARLLTRGLRLACGEPWTEAEIAALLADALACPYPRVGLQSVVLVGTVAVLPAEAREALRAFRDRTVEMQLHRRYEVLSMSEILAHGGWESNRQSNHRGT
ncbi:MAG: serine/threonine protein kinase [Alphaproteobacteria bacterium]|nr:serine/threonine protein kinase [Alphaproteobacteria bacterium]